MNEINKLLLLSTSISAISEPSTLALRTLASITSYASPNGLMELYAKNCPLILFFHRMTSLLICLPCVCNVK